jgi:hypothetical protein
MRPRWLRLGESISDHRLGSLEMLRSLSIRLMGLLCCLGWSAVSTADEVTLDEIKAQLRRWEEQIPQFWMAWEVSGEAEGKRGSTKYEWARSPRDEEYRHSIGQRYRHLVTRDAERGYFPTYKLGASATDPPATLRYGTPGRGPTQVVEPPFFGLWSNHQDAWLGTSLTRLAARRQGTRNWKGRELPLLIVQENPRREIELALDPEAGYLPRLAKHVHMIEGEQKDGFMNEVTDFREVEPGFFFPWSGRFSSSGSVDDWTMLEVRVNEPLDPALFRVEPGPETKIENAIAGPLTPQDRAPPPPPLIQQLRWPLLMAIFFAAIAFVAKEALQRRKDVNPQGASGSDHFNSD